MKYVVVGFPKCGQMSMVEYLRKKGHEAEKYDVIWHKDAEQRYLAKYARWTPVIITRNPLERIWSGFNYWQYRLKGVTFPEYLKIQNPNSQIGEESPILQSDYERWMAPFLKYDPLIISLEDMKDNPLFPHENKTAKKDPFDVGLRKLAAASL